jgi:hypothetical protein
MKVYVAALGAGILALALGGCLGPTRSSPSDLNASQTAFQWSRNTVPVSSGSLLYVADSEQGLVRIYSQSGERQRPRRSLEGFSNPEGLAVDAHGDLYVDWLNPNGDIGTISVFHQRQNTPSNAGW